MSMITEQEITRVSRWLADRYGVALDVAETPLSWTEDAIELLDMVGSEQRQRADMAEEREKGLRTALEEILEVSFQLRLEPHMEEIIDIARGSLNVS